MIIENSITHRKKFHLFVNILVFSAGILLLVGLINIGSTYCISRAKILSDEEFLISASRQISGSPIIYHNHASTFLKDQNPLFRLSYSQMSEMGVQFEIVQQGSEGDTPTVFSSTFGGAHKIVKFRYKNSGIDVAKEIVLDKCGTPTTF